MQIVAIEEIQLLQAYAPVTVIVFCNGERLPGKVGLLDYHASCGDPEVFSFGNASTAGITIRIDGAYPDLKDQSIEIRWKLPNLLYNRPLFQGTVESAVVSAGKTTVVAWDAMYTKGGGVFDHSTMWNGDCRAQMLYLEIASKLGVGVDAAANAWLEDVIVYGGLGSLKDEISISAAAGYVAGLVGGNAYITRQGYLSISHYEDCGLSVDAYSGEAVAKDRDFTVTGITLQRTDMANVKLADGTIGQEESTREYAAGDGTLVIENPLADQAAADCAFNVLNGLNFRPGSYSFPIWLTMEPGDRFTVSTMHGLYSAVAVDLQIVIDGGVKVTASCGGWPQNGGAAGQINQALASLVADYARLQMLIAENVEITNARINNLQADDIIAGVIRSEDYEAVVQKQIYPSSLTYPSVEQFPNYGEEIRKGFAVDFTNKIIRGTFASDVTDALERRVAALEAKIL